MNLTSLSLKSFARFTTYALNLILPPRCLITGELVERNGMIGAKAWSALEFIANPLCSHCGFPFGFEVEEGALCASCIDYPPVFASARSALVYNEGSKSLVLGFKHGDQTHAILAFTPWLKAAGKEMLEQVDILVPVPLHPWRIIRRRYNQAALMAYALGRETGHEIVPDMLRRVRATSSQGHLSHKDRARNVRRAFALHPKYKAEIKGKHIALIDDVYTTGSTVRECSKTLLQSGAASVHILTLARVVREGFG